MTNQEILTKAIQKAIDGGWDVFGYFVDGNVDSWELLETREGLYFSLYTDLSDVGEGHSEIARWHVNELIFTHDFAKALWGDKPHGLEPKDVPPEFLTHEMIKINRHIRYPLWQYRLRDMVIADDPIKYLGENI